MIKLLLVLIAIFFLVLILMFGAVFRIVRFLLNPFSTQPKQKSTHQRTAGRTVSNKETLHTPEQKHHQPVIDADEGEYVEFEEIKDK